MGKALTYSGLAVSFIITAFVFVTAKTYTQLIIAVLLYPLLAYFALRVLPRRNKVAPSITIQIPSRPMPKTNEDTRAKVVADIDKRTFLKLIGTAGLSFFVFSLLGRRVESLLFGRAFESGVSTSGVAPSDQASSAPQPLEGFKISEIDDGIVSYYGFTNKDGAWLIMREDTQASSFRYAKGERDFSRNWASRQKLKYDYYFNLF